MLNKKRVRTAIILSSAILLGGCFNMNEEESPKKPNEESKAKEGMNAYEKENFIPIQEYTGEGYELRDAKKETREIANEHRVEVEKAVKDYFKKEYKTEVKVHNIVSAIDGVSVFVESIGAPHFYTFAIVPVDIQNREIDTDKVWSQEGQVEDAIAGSLYVMANEKKFESLDKKLSVISEKYSLTGKRVEALQNTSGKGYATGFYKISTFGDNFKDIVRSYLENPDYVMENYNRLLSEDNINSEEVTIGIQLYMMNKDKNPDKEVYQQITKIIDEDEGLPKGSYTVVLNSNYIDKTRAIGTKDNSLGTFNRQKIIKE